MNLETKNASFQHVTSNQSAIGDRATFMDKFHVTVVATYVAFSAIYWFPGISHVLISQAKILIFVSLVSVGLLRININNSRQFKIYFWLAFCALGAFVANSISTNMESGLRSAQNFVEPLLWLIALYGIRPRAYILLVSRLTITMPIFFLFTLFPLAIYFGYLPNFYAPNALVDPTGLNINKIWVREAASIVGGGFNGGSTGWGAAVAPAALMTAALFLRGHRAKGRARLMATVIILGSAASIIITGARGATFALVAVVAYGLFLARGFKASKIIIITAIPLFIFAVDLASFLPENFLRNFDVAGDFFARLNAISTGRLESYVGGLKHFAESPIFGKGAGQALVWVNNAQYVSVHNIWIGQLAESGLAVFLPMIILTKHLVLLIIAEIRDKNLKRDRHSSSWPNMHLVILVGLIMALVEPSVVIGSFNANVIFWTAIWFALARPRTETFSTIQTG